MPRTGVTSGVLNAFDSQLEPTLTASVDYIVVRSWNTQVPELWWCASLQSGELEDPWGHLPLIVDKKNEKAAAWDWRCADERWLLVVAEAQTLEDTMVLSRHRDDTRLRSLSVTLESRSAKISGRGRHPKYAPYAFTEQGVAMLSSVLRSPRAIDVNIEIMRAFVRLREMLTGNRELARKLAELEKRYDAQFRIVFEAIRELMEPPNPPRRRIGFGRDDT